MIPGVPITQDGLFSLLAAVCLTSMLGTMAALVLAHYLRTILAFLLRVTRPLLARLAARFQVTTRGDHRA